MLHTLEMVRDSVRNREGKRVFFLPKGDSLTSEAKDFLSAERIEIRPGEGKFSGFETLDGGVYTEKPEHMTHLRGNILVPKTHPRILLRGKVDTLEAEILLAQAASPEPFREKLGQILDFVRMLMRCEVMEEPVPEIRVLGLTPEEIREHSHYPQKYYGQGHFMPTAGDGLTLLQVNKARTAAREAELAAVAAFTDREGSLNRKDLVQALNRVSSLLYILEISIKAKG